MEQSQHQRLMNLLNSFKKMHEMVSDIQDDIKSMEKELASMSVTIDSDLASSSQTKDLVTLEFDQLLEQYPGLHVVEDPLLGDLNRTLNIRDGVISKPGLSAPSDVWDKSIAMC